MQFFDLEQLNKYSDEEFYDLFKPTYSFKKNSLVLFKEYTIQKGESGRIDLIGDSIYGDVNYGDIICNVNNVSNPLNFKNNQTIKYPVLSQIESLRVYDKTNRENQRENVKLSNPSKNTRKDKNRQKYNNNNSLPPTITEKNNEAGTTNGGSLVIGEGLF